MPLLFVLFCQGFFGPDRHLYRVEGGFDAKPAKAIVLVDLGWYSLPAGKERADTRYHVVGNLQALEVDAKGRPEQIGDFGKSNPLVVTIEYPPPKQEWNLYFWARSLIKEGAKWWVPLLEKGALNPGLKDYGIELEIRPSRPFGAERGGLTLAISKWPDDDIIIAWDN